MNHSARDHRGSLSPGGRPIGRRAAAGPDAHVHRLPAVPERRRRHARRGEG